MILRASGLLVGGGGGGIKALPPKNDGIFIATPGWGGLAVDEVFFFNVS